MTQLDFADFELTFHNLYGYAKRKHNIRLDEVYVEMIMEKCDTYKEAQNLIDEEVDNGNVW